jgi:hypothetical protein
MYAKAMRLKKTILLLALMGCVHTESLKQVTPEQLVEHIEREESKIHSVKGQARLKLDSPEQKGVVEVLVAARHPDSIHLQLLDGLGRPVRIFVSHAGRFALWDMEKGTFYRGVATQNNLARFLPLYFSPEELVKVLLGAAPRLPGAKAQPEISLEGAQTMELLLTTENLSQRLRVQPKNFRVTESEVRGTQNYQLTFASFVRVGSQKVFPERRILKVLSPPLFLELSYTDYSVDLSLEEKLFILVPPPGIRVVDVEEGVSLNGD